MDYCIMIVEQLVNSEIALQDHVIAVMPLWGGIFVLYTKCMEKTTMVNKIACHLCMAYSPAIVWRLFITNNYYKFCLANTL